MRLKFIALQIAAALLASAFAYNLAVGQNMPASKAQFIKAEPRTSDEAIPVPDNPGTAQARFPVTLDGAQAGEINFQVVDVLLDDQAQSNLVGAFSPKMEETLKERAPAILIDVDLTQVREEGKYHLSIKANKSGAEPVPLELQVILPTAQIRPPKTLVVKRVLPFFFTRPEVNGSLNMQAISKHARLTDIRMTQFDKALDEEGQPIDGCIVINTDGRTISHDNVEKFNYSLVGDFPLGTTKGSIEVKAPQLAEALPFNFEVRSSVDSWVIFLIIAIGLVIGWLVRTGLQRRIELNKVKLQAIELQQRIAKELQQHPDEDFSGLALAASMSLTAPLSGKDAAALKSAITDADKALSDALTDLKTRRAAAREKLEELEKLVKTKRALPDTITVAVSSFDGRVDEASRELKKDNVKVAGERAEAIRGDLGAGLETPIREWKDSVRSYLDELSKDDILLPASLITDLKLAVTSVKEVLVQIKEVSRTDTTGEIIDKLEQVHSARMNVADLLFQLRLGLEGTLAKVVASLGQAPIPDKAAVERLKEQLSGAADELARAADRPQDALKELPGKLAALHTAWGDALLSQVPAGNAGRKGIEDLIKNRDYISAAEKVVEALKPNLEEGTVLGSLETFASGVSGLVPDLPKLFVRNVFAVAPAFITRSEREEELRDPLVVQQVRTRKELFKDSLIRNFLVALLVTVVGYMMFADKFVGTFDDVAKVFFWAFAIDLTVEALLEATKGLKTT